MTLYHLVYFDALHCNIEVLSKQGADDTVEYRVKSCAPIDLYFSLLFKWQSQTGWRAESPTFLEINLFGDRNTLRVMN
jgi:hypothetical protein